VTRDRVEAWLAERRPTPPRALADRLARALAAYPEEGMRGAATVAELMGALGVAMLGEVSVRQAGGAGGTGAALDLLAADALVTYAFEAAAEEEVEVGPLVARLLERAVA
jgi:hypothetical protein